jgi:cytochrome P450
MTTVEPADVLAFPAARGGCPFAPPPAYQQALDEHPISRISLWDGSGAWLVTRNEDVRAVLGDRRFSADATAPGFPFVSESRYELATGNVTFIRQDDPEHNRVRRMITGDFIIKRVEAMGPEIQGIVDGFLDRMTAHHPPADLVSEFALPVPSLVICLLLGVPYEDHDYFQQRSRVMLSNLASVEQVRTARQELNDYLRALAERKRQEPDDRIISKLVLRDDLGLDEIARISLLLLVAGHETTANMTALSTLALLRDPDQLARLRAEPELIRGAVEELLRFLSIVQDGVPRTATEPVRIGGQTIGAGEGVVCMLSTANRDEALFARAERLDVTRDARRHVAFGFGVHQCLGQPLARLELRIILETLLRRLPGLRLAVPYEQIRFRQDTVVHGLEELPVAW